jgi:hypothetical protein
VRKISTLFTSPVAVVPDGRKLEEKEIIPSAERLAPGLSKRNSHLRGSV